MNKELCAAVFAEMCLAQHLVTSLSKESLSHFICESTQNLHLGRVTRTEQTVLAETPQEALLGFV